MEDYRDKLEGLTLERLQALARRYRETIAKMEYGQREARAAGSYISLAELVDYTDQEIAKKREDLAEIERLLAKRKEGK